MQVVDAATTMGILFGCMGVGAFVGPVVFNMFTPPKCASLSHCDCAVESGTSGRVKGFWAWILGPATGRGEQHVAATQSLL